MIDPADIREGTVFHTPFESGCVALEAPDVHDGAFSALDSEGVECFFQLAMVSEVVTSDRP